jgi:hypothetical protein
MYDESVVKPFQAERQSLAMMDHPAIAQVFDAGTTPRAPEMSIWPTIRRSRSVIE